MIVQSRWIHGGFVAVAVAVVIALGSAPPAEAQPVVDTVETAVGPVVIENLVGGLVHPWGMAFLPDGRMLITERTGRLRIYSPKSDTLSAPVPGTPMVFDRGQGGMLDVAVDPNFASNRYVYLSFAEPGDGGASTALGRGRLINGRLHGFEVIFRQLPKVSGAAHFGGRIVFSPEGRIFLTLGERFKGEPAQDLSDHLGDIVRINRDGSIPPGNPFVDKPNARDAIWSWGHRNVEAAAINPGTGQLWIAEMGPAGGDELNLIIKGGNYGWPVVSWGEHYNGNNIPDPPTHPRFIAPVIHWTPVISPSGMLFYTSDVFKRWRGSALIGALSGHAIVRVDIDNGQVTGQWRIPMPARIRDVAQGPEGLVYVLTDQQNGNLWHLHP